MALEAMFYQQDYDHNLDKDFFNLLGDWSTEFSQEEDQKHFLNDIHENQTETSFFDGDYHNHLSINNSTHLVTNPQEFSFNDSIDTDHKNITPLQKSSTTTRPSVGRSKRRRSRNKKNKEDIETQRMTHIAVERNRRKQMNEYLAIIQALMPKSYVQRGDQATIIGGAINYVKDLEQKFHLLSASATKKQEKEDKTKMNPSPFTDFFTFPQYSTFSNDQEARNSVADIEVTIIERHANLKIRTERRPKQLLMMVTGLQNLSLTIFHLNVTSVDQLVLYSLSLKVEENCRVTTVDEIAKAVHELLSRIQEDGLVIN